MALADWCSWKSVLGRGATGRIAEIFGISWAMKIVLSSVLLTGNRSNLPSYLLETREMAGGESKGRERLESNQISSLISSLLLWNTKRISQRFRDWEASGLLWVHSMFLLDWKSHAPGPCRAHLLEHILPRCRCVYMKWDVSCVCIHPHAHTEPCTEAVQIWGTASGVPGEQAVIALILCHPHF